jgi:hypothetical protein
LPQGLSSRTHQHSHQSSWVNAAGTGELSIGFGDQSADRFYAGDTELPLPVDLEMQTTFLSASYGITDRLSIDAQLAYGQSDFAVDPVLAPRGGLSGVADSKIGLRYSLYSDNGAAIAVKAAAILEGNYDTGAITAIGDGGSGVELALLGGKSFDSGFAINGEIGYRKRSNDVPDDIFGGVTASYAFNDTFGVYAGYQFVRADGDLDIGGPGFSPPRFPEVDEEYDVVQGGLSFNFSENWGAGFGYGRKIDGRNTAKSDFWNVALTYSF